MNFNFEVCDRVICIDRHNKNFCRRGNVLRVIDDSKLEIIYDVDLTIETLNKESIWQLNYFNEIWCVGRYVLINSYYCEVKSYHTISDRLFSIIKEPYYTDQRPGSICIISLINDESSKSFPMEYLTPLPQVGELLISRLTGNRYRVEKPLHYDRHGNLRYSLSKCCGSLFNLPIDDLVNKFSAIIPNDLKKYSEAVKSKNNNYIVDRIDRGEGISNKEVNLPNLTPIQALRTMSNIRSNIERLRVDDYLKKWQYSRVPRDPCKSCGSINGCMCPRAIK